VVVVDAPMEIRIQRTIERDHTTEDQVKERISKQYQQEEKVKLADYVIHNDGHQMIMPQVIKVHSELIELSKQS